MLKISDNQRRSVFRYFMKNHRYLFLYCLLVVSVFLLPGCSSEPKQYVVSGEVTYKGQPVAQGEIVFADAKGGTAATAAGKIKDGRYQIRILPGDKKVRITSTKETGKMLEGAMGAKYPERVDLIPAKYNSATTLTRTITPESGTVDFRLE